MTYIEPSENSARALIAADTGKPLVMLNLLRFRELADYTQTPGLGPDWPISGAEAFERYVTAMLPLLHASGGELVYRGTAAQWLIGPAHQRWDQAMIVRQSSLARFLAFGRDPAARAVLGHRTAALANSRLLPTQPIPSPC